MVGLGKPVKPNDEVLIRSREALAFPFAWTWRAPAAAASRACARSMLALASASVGLEARASRMVRSRAGEPRAFHQGPAARSSGARVIRGAAGSPDMR